MLSRKAIPQPFVVWDRQPVPALYYPPHEQLFLSRCRLNILSLSLLPPCYIYTPCHYRGLSQTSSCRQSQGFSVASSLPYSARPATSASLHRTCTVGPSSLGALYKSSLVSAYPSWTRSPQNIISLLSHWWQTEENNDFPWQAGRAPPNEFQSAISLTHSSHTLLAHVQPGVVHSIRTLFGRAATQSLSSQPASIHRVIPHQVQNFALPLLHFHEFSAGPVIECIRIPLDRSSAICRINTPAPSAATAPRQLETGQFTLEHLKWY